MELKQLIDRYEAASFAVDRRMQALIRERNNRDLTADQYRVLRSVRKNGPSTSTELADQFCVGKSSITAIVTRLVDKQMLTRLEDPSDRRVIYLHLTEKGKHIEAEMDANICDMVSKYLRHFRTEDVVFFIEMFEKLALLLGEEKMEEK